MPCAADRQSGLVRQRRRQRRQLQVQRCLCKSDLLLTALALQVMPECLPSSRAQEGVLCRLASGWPNPKAREQ